MTPFLTRKQQFKDNIQTGVSLLRENLAKGMKPRKAAKAVKSNAQIAGLDPVTIMLIIKVLILIAQWYFNKKADPKTTPPPDFLLEINDDHFAGTDTDSDDD